MAGASLLSLLDDIATLLDDIALMSKVAAKKTAGVLGDDLALNAQQVTGVSTERELPVIWAVAKGSFINKAILIPAALLISTFIPWAITPLLMFGGLFLCYEGVEKIYHSYQKKKGNSRSPELPSNKTLSRQQLINFEKNKVKGAIRTDFVLSAEIIAITLGVVAHEDLFTQASTLAIIAIVMTIGVYGLVAAIVRMDDVGAYLLAKHAQKKAGNLTKQLGLLLLTSAPKLMKWLAVAGTIAMFMVGGGILEHGLQWFDDLIALMNAYSANVPIINKMLVYITPSLIHTLFGVAAGATALFFVMFIVKIKERLDFG
ncbi:MAG: DUF808 domain-containing protein [Parashewanella sp.]